jgi:hypothetical protein
MAIYDPKDDAQLEATRPKRRIIGWSVRVEWDNGEVEDITEVPDDVAGSVDMWLTEIEQELEEQG